METLKQPKFTGIIWLLLRLWLGYNWAMDGFEKVFGEGSAGWVGDKAGTSVMGFLKGAIAKSYLAPDFVAGSRPGVQNWYADLVQNVFMPNATLFSYMVAYGELLVGIALIIGIFTRFSALMGVIMNLSYLLAGTVSVNPQMLVIGLIILMGGAGVTYYAADRFVIPFLKAQIVARSSGGQAPKPRTA